MEQQGDNTEKFYRCSHQVIGACIEVHRHLGPGLLESAYEECLCHELRLRGLAYQRQVALPVRYKGIVLDNAYRLDLVVERCVLIEVKAIERILPIHHSQVLTYLKMSALPIALLINFGESALVKGVRRFGVEGWRGVGC